ncbi:MAG: hypothetical protein WC367_03015, partial [Methanoregula sp.]
EKFSRSQKQKNRLALKGGLSSPDGIPVIEKNACRGKNVSYDQGKCGRDPKKRIAPGEYLNGI